MNKPVTRSEAESPFKTECWIEDSLASSVEYYDYWNDEAAEKDKEWYVLDGDFKKMENYLKTTGLEADIQQGLKMVIAKTGHPLRGTGIDLAAGNLWAIPYLLAQGEVDRVYCLEFSKHRLLKMGPRVLEHYQIPVSKAVLVWGSFYTLRLADASLDFAFLSAAFHHADKPMDLLREIKRVLKPGGIVLMLGEHRVGPMMILKQVFKSLLARFPLEWQKRIFGRTFQRHSLNPRAADFMDVEVVLGDHEYTDAAYREMFFRAGFEMTRLAKPGGIFQSFLLTSQP